MDTLSHGTFRTEITLHLGQCWAWDSDCASTYTQGPRGIMGTLEVDLSGLIGAEIHGYDRDADEAYGDDDTIMAGVDCITYDDEDHAGQPHRTLRIMSENALNVFRAATLDIKVF